MSNGKSLVVGFGVTGEALARHLGEAAVVIDDTVTDDKRARATELGVALIEAPDETQLAALINEVDAVVTSPGVPLSHPVHRLADAAGVDMISEVELAFRRSKV